MFKTPMQKQKIKQQLDTSKITNPTAYSNLWDTMKMFKNRNLQLQVPTFKKIIKELSKKHMTVHLVPVEEQNKSKRNSVKRKKLLRSGRN